MKKKNVFNRRRIRRYQTISRAQGLVEFALILPVILLTLFVLVELARVLHAWMAIENGARAGVRYAVTAEYNPDHCPPTGCASEEDEKNARVASIHDAAWAGSSSIVRVGWDDAQPDEKSFFDVIVCDPTKLLEPSSTFDTYSCDDGENPGDPGDQVVVVVEFNHPLIAPLLTSIWPQLRLDAKREAKVETYRVPQPVGTAPAYDSPTPRPTNTPMPTSTWTPGPPPPDLCKNGTEWRRSGGRTNYSTYMQFLIHEAHGWDTGSIVNEAYISRVYFDQDPETFRVDEFEFHHPGTGTVTINVNEKDERVEVSGLNIPLFPCYPDYCDNKYHAMYVEVHFNGVMDGEYTLRAYVEFPEYGKTCNLAYHVDTNPPEPEPTDTAGPSPTDEPYVPDPTDTPRPEPTDTPPGPIDTPEPPPD